MFIQKTLFISLIVALFLICQSASGVDVKTEPQVDVEKTETPPILWEEIVPVQGLDYLSDNEWEKFCYKAVDFETYFMVSIAVSKKDDRENIVIVRYISLSIQDFYCLEAEVKLIESGENEGEIGVSLNRYGHHPFTLYKLCKDEWHLGLPENIQEYLETVILAALKDDVIKGRIDKDELKKHLKIEIK